MLWLILWTIGFISTFTLLSIKYNHYIQLWAKDFLFKKFGLKQIKKFDFSYSFARQPYFIIHIEGVHITQSIDKRKKNTHGITAIVSRQIPKTVIEFMLNFPIRILMRVLSNKFVIHIDDLTIQRQDNISLHLDHIYIESKLATNTLLLPVFSTVVQIGPIQLSHKVAEKSFVVIEMTTLCLVTLSCHLKTASRITLDDLDLEIQLGKLSIIDIKSLLSLDDSHSTNTTTTTTSPISKWKKNSLNSVHITVQYICFNHDNICLRLNNIDSLLVQSSNFTLSTELIQCNLFHAPLFTMPSMEINLSEQSDHDTSNNSSNFHAALPQHTVFLSVTWILNSPIISLPLNNTELMSSLLNSNESITVASPLTIKEKMISNLPMCTFAFVVNSPKIELSHVDNDQRCGYLSTSSFIIRLSGEYMSQGNSSSDSILTSSSSSSSSNLDALFAQEEYQWLKNTRQKSSTSKSTSNKKWFNLMGRVSRKHQQHQQPTIGIKNHKKWSYRISVKIIIQKLNLGYSLLDKENELVRIKNAVLIFKTKSIVLFNSDIKRYDTIFNLESNNIHSEVALDKPVIYFWNDQDALSSSVFWIKHLPQCLEKYKPKSTKTKVKPLWISILIKNMSFSLDVIKGSIVTTSLDKYENNSNLDPQPPQGYFSNKPNEEVYTQLVLDTQKFTFACDGPGNNLDSEWKTRCHLENLYIQQTSHVLIKGEDEEKKKQHVILWISQLNLNARFNSGNFLVTAKIKKYGIFYSIRNHYVCLLLARSLDMMKHQLVENDNRSSDGQANKSATLFSIQLEAHVERGDIQVHLPQDIKIYLRLDDLLLQHETNSFPIIKFRNFMVLGVSPFHLDSWEQLVEIDKAQIILKQEKTIELKSRKIFASVPYQYVLSAVIENMIGLVKAIKELHSRILFQNLFTFFGPNINNEPILIPCIHIKTRIFTIHFDDDPFESKLRNILRTGLVEQQKRLAYREALDDKIYEMLSTSNATTADSISTNSIQNTIEENSTYIGTPSPDMEVHLQIIEANKSLLERYSEFWIKNINQTKTNEADFYQNLHIKENYRHSITSDVLDDSLDEPQRLESFTFSIDIRPRPLAPPLANFTAQFVKVSFQPADFSLSETRQFIHAIGGGVPIDNDFSIIIPFHLSIKAGKTWIKMRDYPLPLLYVPPPTSEDNTRKIKNISWTLEGNYAIGDEVGNSGGSRIIPISIVPSSCFSGYCLSAVRTASPLKFYSVIDYHVLTKSMSTICWSISYNPAIQDIIRVLEGLSSTSVDPSPRIGFWDKVRFMIHTQTKISFIGGGDLAIVVKGTRDPYLLQGRGAGLAKIWSNNVVWLLGYKNSQNEFMQFISKDYAFGVPNLVQSSYVPYLPDSLQTKKSLIEHKSKFLKIALKLTDGIRMGIGLHFERLGCSKDDCLKCKSTQKLDRCRTQIFSPHYNVIYQSVKQVQAFYDVDTYDAFKGFRSDFIHLSLSIVKLQNGEISESPDFSKDDPYFMTSGSVSQNAMYLSPCFIKHFMTWYRLFGSPISLPVRQGKLFPRDEPKSPSFGEHLDTVKYKIVVSPLGIGYFCTDDEAYLDVKGGGSAGLKARVNAFSVDLHSRKEVIKVDSPTTSDEATKTERIFHEVELELHDIDLRVVKSSHAKGLQTADNKSTSTSYYDAASFDEDDDENSTKYSFQWVDSKDYVLLDSVPQQNNLSRRKIEIHPFAFSPLLYYIKQNDEVGTERRQYLRGTHDCIMGKGMDSHEFQKAHLNRRASDLDKIIENHDKQLDVILNAMNSVKYHDQETLNEQHHILIEKLNYLRTNRYMLHNYIAQLILETELNISENSGINRDSPNTTTSSICRRDELSRWETLMGHFKDRFFIHNPQIIWNNSVRDAIYYWQDIKNSHFVQDYNLSARCLKFLEDLVHTAEKQQQWKPDVPLNNNGDYSEVFTDDLEMDKNVTQELIEKLLSERSHNFVAYNEKEEEKSKHHQQSQNHDGIYVDSNDSENVNDPDYQYKNIPENYEMKSKYLIDMINPQVNFQSEKGLNHLILFTNERIHVKAFGIVDNSSSGTADKEIRFVKDRIIVSLDNAQLLVAKRMELLSFNLLTQSSYGQCRNLHWAAWVHPEHVWHYKDVNYFDNFQRVASQLSGTIQLDRYNHLRIKIDKYNTSRKSPFEDRTNTMQLHFPYFKLTLNSQQGHILYYTLINLLLGNDGSPRKKQRLNRFKDVMLAAERSDLAETVKQVGVLQNRSRVLMEMHRRFIEQLPNLDSMGIREFNRNRKKMRENLEKLYLVVEAIKSIQTFRRDIHLEETDNAMRFSFTSDEIVWEAVMDDKNQSSLCKWIFVNTKYVFLDKQNGSSKNTIEIDKMQIQNTTDSPVFINVLDRYVEPSQLEEEPNYSRQKMLRGVLESLPPVGGIPVIQQLEINLLPLHLQISTAFGSAMKDYFFPCIVGSNSTQTNAGSSTPEDEEEGDYDDSDDYYIDEEEERATSNIGSRSSSKSDLLSLATAEKSNASILSKREGSFASFDLLTQRVKQSVSRKKKAKSDELTIMKKRSSTNRTFIYVRIPATKHCLSLQGPSRKTFYNLYNFTFEQPNLEYRNRTWSVAEMMEDIQRQFLRAILRHSPALLKNKLLSNNKQSIRTPNYAVSISSKITAPSIKSASSSRIDFRDDSSSTHQNGNTTDVDTIKSSYNTEDESLGGDVKSLNSVDLEQEIELAVDSQASEKRLSFNIDKELVSVYLKRYREEEQEVDELVVKGKKLFGERYRRSTTL